MTEQPVEIRKISRLSDSSLLTPIHLIHIGKNSATMSDDHSYTHTI